MKILLVEDHELLANVTTSLLREVFDHEVTLEGTVAGALATAKEASFDMALIDINLPDGDGYELASRIRSLPGRDEVVLVALTGLGNHVDPARSEAAGIDACFTKPMDFALLPTIERKPRGGTQGNGPA